MMTIEFDKAVALGQVEMFEDDRRTEIVSGTMEDVGATYPICIECGYVGNIETKDGDDCPECTK